MNFFGFNKCLAFLMSSIFIITAGCSGQKPQPAGGMKMPPTAVKVVTVEAFDKQYFTSYIAQAEGSKAVEVRAQVSGILTSQNYTAGQFLNAGDLMFTIEADTYKAAVVQAQGNVAQTEAKFIEAKENYDRIKNLYAQTAVSKKDFDAALSGYDGAKASVETAKAVLSDAQIRLGYTRVIAPVSGYTSKANFSQGNLITASSSQPLTVINTVDPIYINFAIPASTLSSWRILQAQKKMRVDNNTVQVVMGDGSVYGEVGDVIFVDKRIDPTTGDVQIRAEFKNPNNIILPGQYVSVKLLGNVLTQALVIPQKAVLQLKTGQMVIVVDENNKANYVPVKLGLNLGNEFLVESGLKSGDRIVVEGINKVVPGSTVNPMSANAPAGVAPQAPQEAKPADSK